MLHLASLFDADDPLPPVVSFAMGTLGFLTPFNVQVRCIFISHTAAIVMWRALYLQQAQLSLRSFKSPVTQDYQCVLAQVINANQSPVYCTLRARKTCEAWWYVYTFCIALVYPSNSPPQQGWAAAAGA